MVREEQVGTGPDVHGSNPGSERPKVPDEAAPDPRDIVLEVRFHGGRTHVQIPEPPEGFCHHRISRPAEAPSVGPILPTDGASAPVAPVTTQTLSPCAPIPILERGSRGINLGVYRIYESRSESPCAHADLLRGLSCQPELTNV